MTYLPLGTKEIFNVLIEDCNKPFSGWDFSYLDYRISTAPLTWSYPSIIIPLIRKLNSLLDMGTGGGEFLATLQPLPKDSHATECYKPNVPIARKKLEPLGVKVHELENYNKMPFESNYFDLIINRHEEYNVKELYRILKKEGYFITQQVDGSNDLELNILLGAIKDISETQYAYWNLDYAVNELENEGFEIQIKKEDFPTSRIFDIGAVVYYLKAVPWQFPDFSVEKYKEKLYELHLKIQEQGYIDISSGRFLIMARK
ncbi:MAG: class I SAM-dependent methyltransferase [Asgard group archaeon]|nr:class I SAM-dependent methyltransferase [Asgard group archaeon]